MNKNLYNRVAEKVGVSALQLLGAERETLSFVGGVPQTALDFEWPRKDGRPLSFIGQLDLAELGAAKVVPWLPSSGRLLFFYDIDDGPWGFDPADTGGWAVLYDTAATGVMRVDSPDDLDEENQPDGIRYLKAQEYLSIPSLERVSVEDVGITEDEEDDYYELTIDAYDGSPLHQITLHDKKSWLIVS